MCRPTVCKKCAKTTWAGCGMHINDVKKNVAADQWCGGHDNDPKDAAPKGKLTAGRGLLAWLGRN